MLAECSAFSWRRKLVAHRMVLDASVEPMLAALFVAGEHDDFVHPRHSQQLHELYAGDKNLVMVEVRSARDPDTSETLENAWDSARGTVCYVPCSLLVCGRSTCSDSRSGTCNITPNTQSIV